MTFTLATLWPNAALWIPPKSIKVLDFLLCATVKPSNNCQTFHTMPFHRLISLDCVVNLYKFSSYLRLIALWTASATSAGPNCKFPWKISNGMKGTKSRTIMMVMAMGKTLGRWPLKRPINHNAIAQQKW